jgi:hypothetical protein
VPVGAKIPSIDGRSSAQVARPPIGRSRAACKPRVHSLSTNRYVCVIPWCHQCPPVPDYQTGMTPLPSSHQGTRRAGNTTDSSRSWPRQCSATRQNSNTVQSRPRLRWGMGALRTVQHHLTSILGEYRTTSEQDERGSEAV